MILDVSTLQKAYVDRCMTELQACEALVRDDVQNRARHEAKIDRLISLLKVCSHTTYSIVENHWRLCNNTSRCSSRNVKNVKTRRTRS